MNQINEICTEYSVCHQLLGRLNFSLELTFRQHQVSIIIVGRPLLDRLLRTFTVRQAQRPKLGHA